MPEIREYPDAGEKHDAYRGNTEGKELARRSRGIQLQIPGALCLRRWIQPVKVKTGHPFLARAYEDWFASPDPDKFFEKHLGAPHA